MENLNFASCTKFNDFLDMLFQLNISHLWLVSFCHLTGWLVERFSSIIINLAPDWLIV